MRRVNDFYEGPVEALPSAVARAAIRDQVCPWCERGPFLVLANHTYAAHGISSFTLHEMAALSLSASICAPDISTRRADLARRSGLGHNVSIDARRRRRPTYRLTTAGLESNRAAHVLRRKRETRMCICGVIFEVVPSSPRRFCSISCHAKQNHNAIEALRLHAETLRGTVVPPKPCMKCEKLAKPLRRGLCNACRQRVAKLAT